jgi:hypothetical protein
MTNLKSAAGRVPITNRSMNTNTPYLLVAFPSKKVFYSLYTRISQEQKDRYWVILNRRKDGSSLEEAGKPFSLSRERVRQIEAKFCRLVGENYWRDVSASLSILSATSFLETAQT